MKSLVRLPPSQIPRSAGKRVTESARRGTEAMTVGKRPRTELDEHPAEHVTLQGRASRVSAGCSKCARRNRVSIIQTPSSSDPY